LTRMADLYASCETSESDKADASDKSDTSSDADSILDAFNRRYIAKRNLSCLDPSQDELAALNESSRNKATKDLKKTGINEDDKEPRPPFKPG